MSGSATFSDAIAAETAANATHTTAMTNPWRGEEVLSMILRGMLGSISLRLIDAAEATTEPPRSNRLDP
jgi:hypothetical protein